MSLKSLFEITTSATALPLGFALVLLVILVVSFRSRPVVFCQYLKRMTGIELSPREVAEVYASKGAEGVRELFLDRIIREDLKTGTLLVPPEPAEEKVAESASADAS